MAKMTKMAKNGKNPKNGNFHFWGRDFWGHFLKM